MKASGEDALDLFLPPLRRVDCASPELAGVEEGGGDLAGFCVLLTRRADGRWGLLAAAASSSLDVSLENESEHVVVPVLRS